ncbi:2'-5' RNA ligase family protein [Streptomyces sp. NPDC052225]|uniref:2'-5' RNA ligase family protein n=1 Tax=Streptomyces sp. NPDC052225 TaxID=3154949 RepID=UPI00342DCA96
MGSAGAGLSGLVVRVPEAEAAVRAWRERLDTSPRSGVPAHVTVLFPFLPADRIDSGVRDTLRAVLGRQRSFEARFERCGRFPGLLYLAPEPVTPFRRLTEAVVGQWPEHPPYGGKYGDAAPHLTVVECRDDAGMERAEADLLARALPLVTHVSAVDLVVHDGTRWQQRDTFPLA